MNNKDWSDGVMERWSHERINGLLGHWINVCASSEWWAVGKFCRLKPGLQTPGLI